MIMRSTCPWHIHNSPLAAQGARFGGGKGGGGGTTYQTQTTQIPPEVRARYDAVNARAEQVAQQPFVPYTGQFVAPINPLQEAAINQIGQTTQGYQPYQQAATTALTGAAEAALPYYGQAGESIQQAQAAGAPYTGLATAAGLAGTQAVNPQALQIGRYMDPYIQSVVAPTMQGLYQQQQQQQSQLMGEQAMRGAFGGDRGAIAAANLARQQSLAAQQAQAGLLSGAYGQALQAAQQQQGVGLGAAQANRAALQQFAPQALAIGQQAFGQPMAAAQAQQQLGQGVLGYGQGVAGGLTGIGQQGTQTGLAAGQALLGAGTLGQQTQQQLNAALYNQFLQQQGYPFQVAQFLANIALGTGPLYGSTTSGTTTVPTPFFSDERVKEDITEIGRTHDGQKIIKFRYKGEPEGTKHIGLSAQDVERHHPEAVSETAEGIKAVDYDAATKHAERAYGGGLLPMTSEGGAVHPSMAGLGFAGGGDVDPKKLFPWGSAGAAPRGGGLASVSVPPIKTAQAPLGSNVRFTASPPQPTGLSAALNTAGDVARGIEGIEKTGQLAKKGYDWLSDQMKPYSSIDDLLKTIPSTSSAHGGRVGYASGGETDDAEEENPAIPYPSKGYNPLEKLAAHQVQPGKLQDTRLPGVAGPSSSGDGGILGAAKNLPGVFSGAEKLGSLGSGALDWLGTNAAISSGLAGASAMVPSGMSAAEALAMGLIALARGGRAGYATDGKVDYTSIVGRGESGNRNVRNPLSGAGGEFQFMPATWAAARKALPHLPASIDDSTREQRLEAMNWLTGENRRALSSSLGRDPSNAELRYAHYFGPSGAAALMKLDPGTRFADLPQDFWHKLGEKFTNTTLLAQNPNLRDETLGGLLNKYRGEFKEGLAPMPAAEHIMARREPPRPGLAPPMVTDVEDLNEDEDEDSGFASGGVARRRGYQGGGEPEYPTEKYFPDYFEPETRRQATEREARIAPFEKPGAFSEQYMPNRDLAPRTPEVVVTGVAPPPDYSQGALPPRNPTLEETSDAAKIYPPQQALSPATQVTAPPGGLVPTMTSSQYVRPAPAVAEVAPAETPRAGLVPPDVVRATTPSGQAALEQDRDFFDRVGDFYTRNKGWMIPAWKLIGGTLASKSPFFGVAAGEGILGAADTMFRQQGIDIQQQQADIGSARQLYSVYKDTLGRLNSLTFANQQNSPEAKALEDQANILGKYISSLLGKYRGLPSTDMKILADVGTSMRGAAPGAAPAAVPGAAPAAAPGEPSATPAPGGAPPAAPLQAPPLPISMRAQQANPSMFDNIPDERNPIKIVEKAQRMAGTVDPAVTIGLYNQASQIEQNWAQTGRYQDRNGVSHIVPGWLENKMSELRGTKNIEYFDTELGKARARTNTQAVVDDLQKVMESYKSGYFDESLGRINAALAAVGYPPLTNTKDPAEYQRFVKNSYELIFKQLGALGGQTLNKELEGMQRTVPTATLEPRANKQLLTNIKAQLEHDTKLFTDQVSAASANPAEFNPVTFYAQWSQRPENMIGTMKQQIGRDLAVRGVVPTGAKDEIGMRFIVEPTRDNGLSRPTPMYLTGYETDPKDPTRAYPIYRATR